jgi:predicted nucleic acid-binding protein
MSDILLDSDIIIAWLRGMDPIAGEIVRLCETRNRLLWTPVSVAEIFTGVRSAEHSQVSRLFLILEIVPIDAAIGRKAGEYLQKYARSHGVELGDALIAASAHCSESPLWTLNKKHYPMKDIRHYVPDHSLS